jgi:hypothetical protein
VPGEISETLEAEVKARVPIEQRAAVDKLVRQRRKSGARISRGDIVREALTEYFLRHPQRVSRANGKEEPAHA